MSRFSDPNRIAIGYDLEALNYYGFLYEDGIDMSSTRQKGIMLSELYNYNCCLKPNSQSYEDNQLVKYEDIMPTGLKNFGYIMWLHRSGESRTDYAYYDYTDCDIYTVSSATFDEYDDYEIPNFNGNNHYLISFSLRNSKNDYGELFFTLPQYYGSNSSVTITSPHSYSINTIKIYKYNYSNKTFTEFDSDDISTTGGYRYICSDGMFGSGTDGWLSPWYWCEQSAWPSGKSGYSRWGVNPTDVGYDVLDGEYTAFRIRDIFGLMGTVSEERNITYKIDLNVKYYPTGNSLLPVTKDIQLYLTVIKR